MFIYLDVLIDIRMIEKFQINYFYFNNKFMWIYYNLILEDSLFEI